MHGRKDCLKISESCDLFHIQLVLLNQTQLVVFPLRRVASAWGNRPYGWASGNIRSFLLIRGQYWRTTFPQNFQPWSDAVANKRTPDAPVSFGIVGVGQAFARQGPQQPVIVNHSVARVAARVHQSLRSILQRFLKRQPLPDVKARIFVHDRRDQESSEDIIRSAASHVGPKALGVAVDPLPISRGAIDRLAEPCGHQVPGLLWTTTRCCWPPA